ncbi:unnamed protein product [Moneuplotes crassus]|uniref:Chromo domain-containing protein n=1 Tax=Euplotes crassus TaxID=5936 RepID=A0AAD1UF61_EUPCR|nr:unnamed protein product [Moneuplotes crassus]
MESLHTGYNYLCDSSENLHPSVSAVQAYPQNVASRVEPESDIISIHDTQSEESECSPIYEVEKVLKSRMVDGQEQFYVKWVGYPSTENTWEPILNFGEGNLPLQRFLQKRERKNELRRQKAQLAEKKRIKKENRKKLNKRKRLTKLSDIMENCHLDEKKSCVLEDASDLGKENYCDSKLKKMDVQAEIEGDRANGGGKGNDENKEPNDKNKSFNEKENLKICNSANLSRKTAADDCDPKSNDDNNVGYQKQIECCSDRNSSENIIKGSNRAFQISVKEPNCSNLHRKMHAEFSLKEICPPKSSTSELKFRIKDQKTARSTSDSILHLECKKKCLPLKDKEATGKFTSINLVKNSESQIEKNSINKSDTNKPSESSPTCKQTSNKPCDRPIKGSVEHDVIDAILRMKNMSGKLYALVQWKKRPDGILPSKTYEEVEKLKKKNIREVCDFYETKIKLKASTG